jgi:hypothetical protein
MQIITFGQSCGPYRFRVGVYNVNPINSCNASYEIECRLDTDGAW